MTQLQKIVEEVKKAGGPAVVDVWIKAIEEGKQVEVIRELRESVKDNRGAAVRIFGLNTVELIEQFSPLKEAEVYLSELMELYKERKDLRQWDKIRIKVAECNMLLEMAGSKL